MEFVHQMFLNALGAQEVVNDFSSFISDLWPSDAPFLGVVLGLFAVGITITFIRSIGSKIAAAILAAA